MARRRTSKKCAKGSHKRKTGKGKRCVKNPCGAKKRLSSGKGNRKRHCVYKRRSSKRRASSSK